jgi:hypothetical protein
MTVACEHSQVEAQDHQPLAGFVVQFAADTFTLFLLSLQQVARQFGLCSRHTALIRRCRTLAR